MRSRIAVSAVGLPAVVGFLWLGGWWLFALLAVVAVVGLHELYVIARSLRPVVLAGYAGVLLTLFGAKLGGLEWMLGGLLLTVALAFVLKGLADTRQPTTVSVGTTSLGVIWIGGGLGLLLLIRDIPSHGRLAALTIILTVFASDTAAYFVGRLVGRHKLAPHVSPGKTWEGFVAGSAVAILVAFFALYKQHFLSTGDSIVLGAVIAVAGPLGDLFESAIKRDMEVKDSGSVLGGHGGILDRVDAVLFGVMASFYVLVGLGYA
jgi:phosphatidate cytidylyltransferase